VVTFELDHTEPIPQGMGFFGFRFLQKYSMLSPEQQL
jgi:hypothetical protein